ncbi:transglycosylase SLT domain-containing protein [Notoacmeibacter ruber]|nr:transglycosylase SLT domain-containing protein [Notoacmeibacter ruber]
MAVLGIVLGLAAPAFASEPQARNVSAPVNLCEREMIAASARTGVPLGVLYAVGLTESGSAGSMRPYALNIAGRTVQPARVDEAIAIVRREQKRGVRLIDVGCMQVNLHYHRDAFTSLKAMFDPALNVAYAAQFLKRLHARHGTWSMAVARYHAGHDNNVAQKRYVCSVIRRMVRSGFGKMTPQAASFCQT